ncbi:macrophage mannose receptor 1-like [Styela clava]
MNSPDENSFLAGIGQGLPFAANLWIGASDKMSFQDDVLDVVDGGWSWSDGSPFSYVNWNSGEPNNVGGEDCAELYLENGRWNDLDCSAFRHFACEKLGVTDNIVGIDVAQSECRSNEACCFKHLGVEKGGIVPDSALSASSIRNQNYNETRGRLNTQETILITSIGDVRIGYHGGWMPDSNDQETSWYQVDFQVHTEFKGIITQGRNGYELNNERQWVKSFKVSYSQDPYNTKDDVTNWEFISDSSGNPIIFQGNRDQDTQVTNLFPRPIIARHMRCHPLTYYDRVSMRLEYIGCRATCLNKIGMNSGYISDERITASQGDAKQARPAVDSDECRADSSDTGADYRGWLSKTKDGIDCQPWSSQTPQAHDKTPQNYPDSGLVGNYCRNPDGEPRPWCFTMDPKVRWDFCSVPICPAYIPTGWSPSSSTTNQWVQVMFDNYFKVAGVTTYSYSTSYVKTYKVQFSDTGVSFQTYRNQNQDDHIFIGVNEPNAEYTDILREPLTTRFLRVLPQSWNSRITLQFEVNGCYADRRITCADKGTQFEEDSVTIACPGGCVEDLGSGIVYGTDTYTESSAICPAAIHAGKLSNAHGGSVSFAKINGKNSYDGSTRHGISSISFQTAKHSMIFNGLAFRCPDNWYPWNDHCYHFSPPGMEKPWTEARADCQAMGGDLVSILSQAENDFVLVTIVQAINGNQVWIGLNSLDTLNWYEWSDGSPVTLTKWYLHQPDHDSEQCVNIYRNGGYWNDAYCTKNYAYMCKKEKEHLPPVTTMFPPTDDGCELGWKGSGNSCYWTSSDTAPYAYANQLCTEMGAHLVSIHDHYEQAFVHAHVTSTVPPTLGYTSWIGMAATNDDKGAQIYYWVSGEEISYTLWDQYQPDVDMKCYFPFVYNGQTYYECTTVNNPFVLLDLPWCSMTPVFAVAYMFCGTGNAQGCGYMDDRSGYWSMDLCTSLRYYTCEKPRIGYTEPVRTTESPRGSCSEGWIKTDNLVECYQLNEFADLSGRATWQQAYDHCTSQNADLVSIHSSVEEVEIAKLVQDYGVNSYTDFWIGLNSISNNAGYSWSDGSPVSYTNWRAGEPSDHNGRENCVESQMLEYSQWNDINCDALRNWICKIGLHRNPVPPPTLPPPQGTEDGGCGEGWIHYVTNYGSEKCYMFVADEQQSWSRAESRCRELGGGHLVAIHDQDENTMVFSRAAQTTAGSLWIGLRDIGGRSFYWSDDSLLDYVNWGPGEPNNYLNNEDCADIAADRGLWNDDNCGLRKSFICEKCIDCQAIEVPPTEAPTGGCPDGFALYGNKCYYSSRDVTRKFQNASDTCQSMSAELAVINNEYEQAFLASYLSGITSNCWIGFYHRNTGSFVWVDQSPVTYVAWDGGQPDNWNNEEGCAEMWLGTQSTGRWNDADCNQEKSFACYVRRSEDYPSIPTQPNDNNCPSNYYSWGRGCYLLVVESKTWQDADKYCRDKGNNLMSIGHVYENELIHSWFWKGQLSSNDKLWIGMSYSVSVNNDDSVNTSFSWTDGWPVQYTNWGQGEPNTAQTAGNQGCVYINSNGQWSTTGGGTTTCDTTASFVCKISRDPIPTEPPIREGNCDPNYAEFNEFCYYINPGITDETSRSWFEARHECQVHGGELASFHSDDEVSAFIVSIAGASSHNLWIGLYSNGYDGWVWSDSTAVEYTNWNDNEPNGQGNGEECVEMYPWSGAWNDVSCYEHRGYVCKKPAGYTRCYVPSAYRIECGYQGISESLCVTHRGCCFDPTYVTANNSGCYYAENEFPSGFPQPPEEISGLSGGAIAGIVIGVIVALVLVGGIVYYMKGSEKSMPSMPTFSTPSFTSKPKAPTESQGFDNPLSHNPDSTA